MRATPWHQTNWDARAAGNFIGGGSGAGLLLCAGLIQFFEPLPGYRGAVLAALLLIALGLLCVLAEIGRPLRSINVLRHPQTSWMTREAMVAPLLFAAAAAAAWSGTALPVALAGLLGASYLYCQARMLQASKGIPAWRHPKTIPLMLTTGVVEGAALTALACALAGGSPNLLAWPLLAALLTRRIAWKSYVEALEKDGAPQLALAALARLRGPLENFGQTLPELLLLVAMVFATEHSWPVVVAAAVAVASGWLLKFSLVTRAAYNQGFALPVLPIRGQGEAQPGIRPGWNKIVAKD